jgi:hypothetical protein
VKKQLLSISLILSATLVSALDLNSLVQTAVDSTTKSSIKSENSGLSDSIVTDGLKEALKIGVDFGVKELSKKDGYLTKAKIPLPENLVSIEKLVRKAGGGKAVDDLILSMNKAATTAAPKTAGIFVNAVDKMTLDDAQKILAGDENAATEYFAKNTTKSLEEMISPIIKETMRENKVASYYETFNTYYKSTAKDVVENSQVMDYAKQFGADKYIPTSDKDLDAYVTEKAIEGLFKMIAEKEAEIRKDPVAQTTDILKKVFG